MTEDREILQELRKMNLLLLNIHQEIKEMNKEVKKWHH
jgi:hypothetical protein